MITPVRFKVGSWKITARTKAEKERIFSLIKKHYGPWAFKVKAEIDPDKLRKHEKEIEARLHLQDIREELYG